MNSCLLHATCVAIRGQGVLLLGKSGSGKSDLALRLMDTGAELVADDQVSVRLEKNTLIARPPASLQGLLEVHGVGIIKSPALQEAPLILAVDLVEREKVERSPEKIASYECLGQALPLLRLCAFDASTTVKIKVYLMLGYSTS